MADSAPKRSQRSGAAKKTRVFDEHTRKEIKRKKLDQLENDNWIEERPKDEEDDDEYMEDEDGEGAAYVCPGL